MTKSAHRALVLATEATTCYLIELVLLQRFGCKVDSVVDGAEALVRLTSERYELVICDLRMTKVSGIDVLRWCREYQPDLAKRFVGMAADPIHCDFAAEVRAFGRPVLGKPFTIESLCRLCGPLLASDGDQAEPDRA